MKKFLSMLLAIVMVLTIAAFPAFAEGDSVISIFSVQSPFGDDGNAIKNAIDSDWNTHHRPAGTYPTNSTKGADGNWYFIVDFAVPYNVTSFRVKWSVNFTTQAVLYGSNDLSGEWTEIADLTFDAQETTTAIDHTGEYRYVKVESYKLKASNPAVFGVEFRGQTPYKIDATVAKASTNADAAKTVPNLIDGDTSTYYSVPAWLQGDKGDGTKAQGYPTDWSSASNTLIFDLGELCDVEALNIYWGAQGGAWGKNIADAYEVYYSADNVTYTPALSYSGLADIVQGGENPYDDADTRVSMKTPSWTKTVAEKNSYSHGLVMETDLGWSQIKYVKIVMTRAIINPTVAEVEIFKKAVFGEEVPAIYTVKYVDEEGNELADSKTVEGKMVGNKVTETAVTIENYKPDAEKKSLVLVDGTNEITFVYYPRQSTTYTIEYVDFDGNPVAPAKTGNSYEDETITAVPEIVAGYLCIDTVRTKSIVLSANAGDNYITFTYNKVLTPTKVIRTQAPGTNNSGSDLARLYDGKFDAYTQYTIPASYDFSTRPAEYVYVYSALTDFDKVSVYTNYNRYTKAKIYTSLDGEEWTLALSSETIRDDQQVLSGFVTEANATATVHLNEFVLPEGTKGTHLKLEIVETNVSDSQTTWCGIYEMAVEGTELVPADLSNATVVEQNSWGWDNNAKIDADAATLFDGEAATNNKGYYGHGYFDSKQPYAAGSYFIEVDLGEVFTDPTIAIQGGSSDWNYTHLLAYDVYVAGIDGIYGDTPVATVDKGALSDANKERVDILTIDSDEVRFVKIVANAIERRPVIGEISVYGEAVNLTTAPEKAAASLGGQIRLPDASLTAGLRFGATIMKGVVGADGIDYDFDTLAAAGAEIGMFMLPADMLGGQTLAQYLAGGGENALKVPAKRVLSESDASVTFTAVLVDIPESAYARDIVAVPYLKVGDNYVYYAEMTKSYKGVATAVAESYKAGETELTDVQIELLEKITGETLVVPVE